MKRLFMLESSELHLVVIILTVSWKLGRWKGTLRCNQGKQEKFWFELQWINSVEVYLKNLSNSLKMWGKAKLYNNVFILSKKNYRITQCVIFTVEIGFHHCSTSSVKTNAWKSAHIYAYREHSMGFFSFLLATNAKHSAGLELFKETQSPTQTAINTR